MNYIKEDEQIHYVVKVNGVAISSPTTRSLAEQQKLNLPTESQALAEIIPVTSEGKQVLFG